MQQSGETLYFNEIEQQYTGTPSVPIIAVEIIFDRVMERIDQYRKQAHAAEEWYRGGPEDCQSNSSTVVVPYNFLGASQLAAGLMHYVDMKPGDFEQSNL